MSKLYNIGAYGIPDHLLSEVRGWDLDLTWSTHAKGEAVKLISNLGIPSNTSVPKVFFGPHWEVVELETELSGRTSKVVVRREVTRTWSIVLVIKRTGLVSGLVKTCWANLNSDKHCTLDISKFTKS